MCYVYLNSLIAPSTSRISLANAPISAQYFRVPEEDSSTNHIFLSVNNLNAYCNGTCAFDMDMAVTPVVEEIFPNSDLNSDDVIEITGSAFTNETHVPPV